MRNPTSPWAVTRCHLASAGSPAARTPGSGHVGKIASAASLARVASRRILAAVGVWLRSSVAFPPRTPGSCPSAWPWRTTCHKRGPSSNRSSPLPTTPVNPLQLSDISQIAKSAPRDSRGAAHTAGKNVPHTTTRQTQPRAVMLAPSPSIGTRQPLVCICPDRTQCSREPRFNHAQPTSECGTRADTGAC